MSRIPITNHGASMMYVGAVMIPAGETRVFEEGQLPPHLRSPKAPAAEPAPEPDDRLEILELSVANFTRHLGERDETGAPYASDEDLVFFREAEAEGRDRKGIIEALDQETLARAAAYEELVAKLDQPIEDFIGEIVKRDDAGTPALNVYQLGQLFDEVKADTEREEYADAIDAELTAREIENGEITDQDNPGAGDD